MDTPATRLTGSTGLTILRDSYGHPVPETKPRSSAPDPVTPQNHYQSPPLPSFVVSPRQQVVAYAVIDSVGRDLNPKQGESISIH
ncbi:MAG: hypothetical protein VW985_05500, partial [Gammaproteobacteria bacterium]